MRLSSAILFLLLFGAVAAHEKHISTVMVSDGNTPDVARVAVSVHLPDYLACSKGDKDNFEQWVSSQLRLSIAGVPVFMKMDSLSWGHDIRAVFIAPISSNAAISLYCDLFSSCFPNQKTIVTARLSGREFGRVLTPQKDTCVFQPGK